MAFKKALALGCFFCFVRCVTPNNSNTAADDTTPGSSNNNTAQILTVVSSSPEANATTAALSAPITVTFSNDVYQFNLAAVSQDFDPFVSLKDDTNTSIGFTASYEPSTFTLTIIPDSSLDYSSTYTLQISRIIKSITGARLAVDFSLAFRTVDGVSLKSLTLSTFSGSALSFSPAFSPTTTTYTATVSGVGSQITVNAAALSSRAKITYNGASSNFINLPLFGTNVISIKVTAADNKTTSTYTLNITRTLSAVNNTQYMKRPTTVAPSSRATEEQFGWHITLSGTTLAVGTNMDKVFVYTINPATGKFAEEAIISHPDGNIANSFGRNVRIDGDYLAIGDEGDDDSVTDSGAVFMYKRTGSNWTLQQKIKAFNAGGSDLFGNGNAMDLSGDLLLVSAIQEDTSSLNFTNGTNGTNGILQGQSLKDYAAVSHTDTGNNNGAAYVYRRNGNVWELEAMLKHSAQTGNERGFGRHSRVSGNKLAISIHDGSTTNTTRTLGVSIYAYKNNQWVLEQADIVPDNSSAFLRYTAYGYIAMVLSGDNLFVGAHRYDRSEGITAPTRDEDHGAVYAFTYSSTTQQWTQQARILPATPVVDLTFFGVSIAYINNVLLVGSEEAAPNAQGGKIYMFQRDQAGAWTNYNTIDAPVSNTNTRYADRMAIGGDFFVTSAREEDNPGDTIDYSPYGGTSDNYGSVYLYR